MGGRRARASSRAGLRRGVCVGGDGNGRSPRRGRRHGRRWVAGAASFPRRDRGEGGCFPPQVARGPARRPPGVCGFPGQPRPGRPGPARSGAASPGALRRGPCPAGGGRSHRRPARSPLPGTALETASPALWGPKGPGRLPYEERWRLGAARR